MRRPPCKPLRRARFNASGRKIGSVTTIYLHFRQAFPMSSEKALRTRAAIIAAARGIILKEGIGALTMDRAAQAAGMSKGACMYHFKNKRALHAALIEDYAAHLDGQMKRHEALFEGRPDETLVPGFVEWFKTASIRPLPSSTCRPTASSTKSSWARAPSEERRTSPDSRLPQACIVLRPGAPASGRLRCAFCASRRMRIDFAVSPLRFFQGAVHDRHDRTFLS